MLRTRLLPFAFCLLPLLVLSVFSASCRQDMHDAPYYKGLRESAIFANGSAARPLVAGTVARGFLNDDTLLYQGKVNGQHAMAFPFPITREDLDRGQERYNIYCAPCHGRTGEGNGMVIQRGYRQAASYHIDRLRNAPVGYLFDVVTNGFGVMPDYKAQIPVEDRWRIIAYVRALQLTHNATTADVPPGELSQLDHPKSTAGGDGKDSGKDSAAAEGGHKAGGQE
jgi:mono/diheme cytochrome c family protein